MRYFDMKYFDMKYFDKGEEDFGNYLGLQLNFLNEGEEFSMEPVSAGNSVSFRYDKNIGVRVITRLGPYSSVVFNKDFLEPLVDNVLGDLEIVNDDGLLERISELSFRECAPATIDYVKFGYRDHRILDNRSNPVPTFLGLRNIVKGISEDSSDDFERKLLHLSKSVRLFENDSSAYVFGKNAREVFERAYDIYNSLTAGESDEDDSDEEYPSIEPYY